MKAAFLLAPAFLATASATTSGTGGLERPTEQTFLLSIEGLNLGPSEYVESFSVATFGITVLAICRIPPGWILRGGGSAAPDGEIAGQATHGVTFLDRSRMGELRGLALVAVTGDVQWQERRDEAGRIPASFSGHAMIGTYGLTSIPRQADLGQQTLRLIPAAQCPPLPSPPS